MIKLPQNNNLIIDSKLFHKNRESIVLEITSTEHFKIIQSNYPKIAEKLLEVCGNSIFDKYTMELLSDTRNGARQGFSDDIGTSILKLNRIHENLMKTN